MCLSLKPQPTRAAVRAIKPKIAKRNIVVYKELKRRFLSNDYGSILRWVSPYQNFVYVADTTYKIPHLKKHISKNKWAWAGRNWDCSIHQGFHAYRTPSHNRIRMIIPKGAEYYISEYGREIVSNQLRTPKTMKFV